MFPFLTSTPESDLGGTIGVQLPNGFGMVIYVRQEMAMNHDGARPGSGTFTWSPDPRWPGEIVADADHSVWGEVRQAFDALSHEWIMASMFQSNISDVANSKPYRSMVGLGPDIVPFILDRMVAEGDGELGGGPFWFPALVELVDSDKAADHDTVPGARKAWLEWARSVGYRFLDPTT